MTFQFCDSMIDEYWTRGFAIFPGIVPPALRRDLRREADKARAIARDRMGPQTPRLPAIARHPDELNLDLFREYCELPVLCDAVARLLGDEFRPGTVDQMAILIEPLEHTWVHGWHRDGAIEVPVATQHEPELRGALGERGLDRHLFNQINCALYRDSALWFVPGSHSREADMEGEVQTSYTDLCPTKSDDETEEEFEQICLDHCRQFPGAVQVHLEPGDFLIYRNWAWHCAHIVKYQPRATLHHTPIGPCPTKFKHDWMALRARARANNRA